MSDSTSIEQPINQIDLHACLGLNACKGLGASHTNDCAGQGDCASTTHPCHTLNDCKGQGGCGLFGTTEEFCHPGENDCKYQGSCGTPILSSRFIAQGPNKGKSVWLLARKLFENRMDTAGKSYGTPPDGQIYGPSDLYAQAQVPKIYESCGQSGARYCSFAFKDAAEKKQARQVEFQEKSAAELNKTMGNCGCE
jgi:hypothetical protein